MKILIFAFGFIQIVACVRTYDDWKEHYNKENSSNEDHRRQVYDMNSAFITLIDSQYGEKYKLELNEFADMTFEDFKSSYLGVELPELEERDSIIHFSHMNAKADSDLSLTPLGSYTAFNAPASVDYRNYSMPVKNQRSCGSCWAFSAIAVLESRMKILNSTFNSSLSEQYLVDCDTSNYGCSGGWPNKAFNWIVQYGENAVPRTSSYQYYGFKQKCRNTTKIPMNIVANIQNNTAGNEDMLKEIVANVGPVAVVVDVTSFFQLYQSGVLDDATCNSNCSSVNHAVVVVGYGTDPVTNSDYWIVKNSWSSAWGQKGYVYMSRNRGNQCNIACWTMYAV